MTEQIKRHYIFGVIISLLVLGIGFAVSTQETKAQLTTVTEGSLTCKVYDEPIESGITFAGNAACTSTDGSTGCFMVCGFTNDAKITCAKGYEPIKWTDGWRCAKAGTENAVAGVTSYTYGTIKASSPPPPPPPAPTTKTIVSPPPPPPATTTKITLPLAPAPTKTEELLKKTPIAEDKVGLSTPVKDTKLETQPSEKKTEEKIEPIDPVLKEVVCSDITEKTKNRAEIMEFLKLMHRTGTYLPPKDLKCKPTVKTKWSVAVQMALTLADESCSLDVSNMPSNQANANQLRNACMTRALELGLIEKKRQGNINKVEFYELMMRGANLASVDELPQISYPDIDADSLYYDIVAQAKFYELVKTYKKKGRPGYILPKHLLMLKDALHIAWKALKKSPILHSE